MLECELDGGAPLRGHDREPTALGVQALQGVLHAGAADELLVQRLVVGAVDGDELVHSIRVEGVHLSLQAGAPDGLHQLLVPEFAAEHLAGGVAHRRENDAARVDHGAVEIEENDGIPHSSDPTPGIP